MNKSQFQKAANISADQGSRWFPCINATFAEYGITDPLAQAMFIAQVGHESSGFTRITENLNYTPEGLRATFKKYFSEEEAQQFGRTAAHPANQEGIANKVYGNRLGNSSAGDGWRYRGRGLIQITGRENYEACGKSLKTDLGLAPQLLEQDVYAARSAGWFWQSKKCGAVADDIEAVTRLINGGLNGLDDRKERFEAAKEVLLS
ncbi:glycoside hydrolase family 19 protein [Enterobacteriaceae bacterium ML5]|nr:glycoside hydrolase family 19 protein [Enterobacteriaceae bacterium ML5]